MTHVKMAFASVIRMVDKLSVLIFILMLACYSYSIAQSQNVQLIANVDDYPAVGYSDCWGYTAPDSREYALLGVNNGISIVEVTDPANIGEVDFIPWVSAPPYGWYDLKTYQNYMYVSSEGSQSILIVDLSALPNPTSVVGEITGLTSAPHNIFVDTQSALLYAAEDFHFNPAVRVYSLADPANPVQVSTIGPANNGTDVHDIFAQDSVLYIAEGSNPTIGIFDMSDPSNPTLLARHPIPSAGYVHQVWVTEDNHYMVTTEETPQKTVKFWDIQNLSNITLIDEYPGSSHLAHNAYFKNDSVYISHYESGLKVVDFSNPNDVVEAGFYDTYPQGESPEFHGAWGVYPFTGNGMIFLSDVETGLYVLRFVQEQGPQIVSFPNNIDFGSIEVGLTSDTISVTLQNFGTQDLTISNISDPGAPFSLHNVPTLPVLLPPHASAVFDVTFSPTQTDTSNGTILINSNDANQPFLILSLTGRGFQLNPAQTGVYYASTGHQGNTPGSLISVDLTTGAGTLIGPTGLSAIPGLAITSSGDIYAASGFSN
ncbi:MAG: choice-of-anchor B family protein, partial [Calditrichaeota bacterium]